MDNKPISEMTDVELQEAITTLQRSAAQQLPSVVSGVKVKETPVKVKAKKRSKWQDDMFGSDEAVVASNKEDDDPGY